MTESDRGMGETGLEEKSIGCGSLVAFERFKTRKKKPCHQRDANRVEYRSTNQQSH